MKKMTLDWDSDDDNDYGSKKYKNKTRACISFFGGVRRLP